MKIDLSDVLYPVDFDAMAQSISHREAARRPTMTPREGRHLAALEQAARVVEAAALDDHDAGVGRELKQMAAVLIRRWQRYRRKMAEKYAAPA
jgi:hypothetical protein